MVRHLLNSMRAIFEICTIVGLILIGWDRPFSEQTMTVFPWMGPLAVTATPTLSPASGTYTSYDGRRRSCR